MVLGACLFVVAVRNDIMKVLMRWPGEFSEVVDGADHRPSASPSRFPEEELRKPLALDLSEYRLDTCLRKR